MRRTDVALRIRAIVETDSHRQLKRLALAHLLSRGCGAAAMEVRCPLARYRIDVAGFLDRAPTPRDEQNATLWTASQTRRRKPPTQTIVIECKQSRSDFLRDRRDVDRLLRRRGILERRRAELEEGFLKSSEPHLRCSGTSLFPECEAWDFSQSRSPAYQALVKVIQSLERDLYGGTKFCTMAHYRLADHLYLIAPKGLLRTIELPPGWGLIECSKAAMKKTNTPIADLLDEPVTIRREAPVLTAAMKFRARLLRNIAVAATMSNINGERAAANGGPPA